MDMKRKTALICIAWLAFVAGLLLAEHIDSRKTHRELFYGTARTLFERIVLTRRWNAAHGGVYVPVTKDTQPNPYLEDPLRDLRINDRLTLTKINPAYMTRQLAELSAESGQVRFHITSLRPIRPENSATPREKQALESFEKGVAEVGEIIEDSGILKFFYMAPLRVDAACLKCHARQGYREGDIRGGISVIYPLPHEDHVTSLVATHSVIALLGVVGIMFFGAKLDKSYKTIQDQAVVDALTCIPNRRALLERGHMEFKRRTRSGKPLAIMLADVDHFKLYNDTYGHAAGDECLKTVARLIKNNMRRAADCCARYGGEEFVILLPDTTQQNALIVAERIRSAIAGMNMPNERALPFQIVTLSIGVAESGDAEDSYEEALKRADQALYAAKNKGRNRVEAGS